MTIDRWRKRDPNDDRLRAGEGRGRPTSYCLLALSVLAAAATVQAEPQSGDAQKGKAVYAQCMACHTINKGGRAMIGPNLYGVIGRKVGGVEGFAYSSAMRAQPGPWTRERLDAYLAAPAKAVPGNRMPFAGIANPTARRDVIAYIAAAK